MGSLIKADGPGVQAQGNLLIVGWQMNYPASIAANITYPFVYATQPNVGPSQDLLQYGYHWVAPFPGKVVSFGVIGISTPGRASDACVCQLLKNGSTFGGGVQTQSFAAKTGLIQNSPFVAGDYWGIRFGIPVAGQGIITASLTVQLYPS